MSKTPRPQTPSTGASEVLGNLKKHILAMPAITGAYGDLDTGAEFINRGDLLAHMAGIFPRSRKRLHGVGRDSKKKTVQVPPDELPGGLR